MGHLAHPGKGGPAHWSFSAQESWCWGSSLEPTEPIDTDWVERGSPRRPTDGGEDNNGGAVIGGADESGPEWDF
jgi:hypothetical protein